MKVELKKSFPDVGFMTEEESKHTFSYKTFILDPIDGTTNLIYDYKMSSISLAYVEGGEVEFGIVFNGEDIIPENFLNLDAIEKIIRKYM